MKIEEKVVREFRRHAMVARLKKEIELKLAGHEITPWLENHDELALILEALTLLGDGEPVAWVSEEDAARLDEGKVVVVSIYQKDGTFTVPLYLHAAPLKQVEPVAWLPPEKLKYLKGEAPNSRGSKWVQVSPCFMHNKNMEPFLALYLHAAPVEQGEPVWWEVTTEAGVVFTVNNPPEARGLAQAKGIVVRPLIYGDVLAATQREPGPQPDELGKAVAATLHHGAQREPGEWADKVRDWFYEQASGLDTAGASEASYFEGWFQELQKDSNLAMMAIARTLNWLGQGNTGMVDDLEKFLGLHQPTQREAGERNAMACEECGEDSFHCGCDEDAEAQQERDSEAMEYAEVGEIVFKGYNSDGRIVGPRWRPLGQPEEGTKLYAILGLQEKDDGGSE